MNENANPNTGGDKKAGHGANKRSKKNRELSTDYVEKVLDKQRNMLKSLHAAVEVDTKFLFYRRALDSELYKYYVETAVKMLESHQLLKSFPDLREVIFNILQIVANV
jgi:hypothetical protein